MVKAFTIDGKLIHDIPSFYDEINRVFMADESWKLGSSLDAFDDLLYGAYGALQGAETATLVWLDLEKSRTALGYEATRTYYQEKLAPNSPFNKTLFSEKLAALEKGTGETYFDLLLAIIASHPAITLVAG